jgi:hypothetical protein
MRLYQPERSEHVKDLSSSRDGDQQSSEGASTRCHNVNSALAVGVHYSSCAIGLKDKPSNRLGLHVRCLHPGMFEKLPTQNLQRNCNCDILIWLY